MNLRPSPERYRKVEQGLLGQIHGERRLHRVVAQGRPATREESRDRVIPVDQESVRLRSRPPREDIQVEARWEAVEVVVAEGSRELRVWIVLMPTPKP